MTTTNDHAIDEEEIRGIVLGYSVTVQCLECGTVTEQAFEHPDPADQEQLPDHNVRCPKCSQPGRDMLIPVACLAGEQVAVLQDLLEQAPAVEVKLPAEATEATDGAP